jgi:hypothetical protein
MNVSSPGQRIWVTIIRIHSGLKILATRYYRQGYYSNARHLHADILDTQDITLSDEYHDTFTIMINMDMALIRPSRPQNHCEYQLYVSCFD